MNRIFSKQADRLLIAALVVVIVFMNVLVEELTDRFTGAQLLAARSAATLLFVLPFAFSGRYRVVPSSYRLQAIRFVLSGVGMLLGFKSYEYISAGSVALIQRMDIPILILLSFTTLSAKRLWLTLSSLVLFSLLLFFSQTNDEPVTGYLIGFTGVTCLALSTRLTKQLIDKKESVIVLIYLSCLSGIFWALTECWRADTLLFEMSLKEGGILASLGLVNLLGYFILKHLFDRYSVEYVRYPFLISAFLTMIMEMIVEHKWFHPLLITGNTAILILLSYLVRYQRKESRSIEI